MERRALNPLFPLKFEMLRLALMKRQQRKQGNPKSVVFLPLSPVANRAIGRKNEVKGLYLERRPFGVRLRLLSHSQLEVPRTYPDNQQRSFTRVYPGR